MNKLPVLTVIYHDSEEHFKTATKAFNAFLDEGLEVTAVINKKLEGSEYPSWVEYIENDQNCLARAWNIGLKELFQTHEYVVVSGLDSICPSIEEIEEMAEYLRENKCGMVSATANISTDSKWLPMRHGDGSFSFYIINKEAYEKVGDFDERYTPAYFEDNDYLERLWLAGYTPMRAGHIGYPHIMQGTVKMSSQLPKSYGEFMTKNLQIFKDTYGKVPDHLPGDITFR